MNGSGMPEKKILPRRNTGRWEMGERVQFGISETTKQIQDPGINILRIVKEVSFGCLRIPKAIMEDELLQVQNVVDYVGWPGEVWKGLKKSWPKIHVGYPPSSVYLIH